MRGENIDVAKREFKVTLENFFQESEDQSKALSIATEGFLSFFPSAQTFCVLVSDAVGEDNLPALLNKLQSLEFKDKTVSFLIGFMHKNGLGTPGNVQKAIEYYTASAEQGSMVSQNNLGYIYANDPDHRDMPKAIKYYTLAAGQGNSSAMCELGGIYANNSDHRDITQAIKYFTESAGLGNSVAMSELGGIYANNADYRDIPQAIKYYALAVEQGYTNAMCFLGHMYLNGKYVPRDITQAIKCFTLAVEKGDTNAMCFLGSMYANGDGVPRDITQAIKYYTLAAERGNLYAQCYLGYMYVNGRDVPRDRPQAIKYFKAAAEQRDANAMRELGYLYAYDAEYRDIPQAMKYYTASAELGNAKAMHELGDIYAKGELVSCDMPKAIKYLTEATKQGLAPSYRILSEIYANGNGGNLDETAEWFVKTINKFTKKDFGGVKFIGDDNPEEFVNSYKDGLVEDFQAYLNKQSKEDLVGLLVGLQHIIPPVNPIAAKFFPSDIGAYYQEYLPLFKAISWRQHDGEAIFTEADAKQSSQRRDYKNLTEFLINGDGTHLKELHPDLKKIIESYSHKGGIKESFAERLTAQSQTNAPRKLG